MSTEALYLDEGPIEGDLTGEVGYADEEPDFEYPMDRIRWRISAEIPGTVHRYVYMMEKVSNLLPVTLHAGMYVDVLGNADTDPSAITPQVQAVLVSLNNLSQTTVLSPYNVFNPGVTPWKIGTDTTLALRAKLDELRSKLEEDGWHVLDKEGMDETGTDSPVPPAG